MVSRGGLASGFAMPTIVLAGTLLLLSWLMRLPGFYAAKCLLALIACALLWLLWSRTRRTNRVIARFVASLQHDDFAQTFRSREQGTGFEELGAALDDALRRLRSERLASASENRFAAALVDEAPTPLLAVDEDGIVHLANKAARRLFREADGRQTEEFARYGAEFAEVLAHSAPDRRRVCRILWNGLSQRAVLATALVDRQGRPWRIISVQIIQSELDAAEMATQTDLVRVLTHEIMNSLTPVTSLATSAARMIALAGNGDPDAIGDARIAVDALARRAAGITHFVDSYREFSRAPSVTIRRFDARPWVEELARSFLAMPQGEGVQLEVDLAGDGLQIDGDADLLGQVVLNLLKNAGEAARSANAAPWVRLWIGHNDAGRIWLILTDNGPGVPEELEQEIFLPFFTTKPGGTGVGLSFARQVVLLHGGAIGVGPSETGRSAFHVVI